MRMAQIMRRLAQLIPESGCPVLVPIEVLRGMGFELVQFWAAGDGIAWTMFWADGRGHEIEVLPATQGEGTIEFVGIEEGNPKWVDNFKRKILC